MRGRFGDRMIRASRSYSEDGVERKIIFLGADCLGLDEPALQKSALASECSDFVLGPAANSLVVFRKHLKTDEPAVYEDITANFNFPGEIGLIDVD